jgi:DNA-binding response OmpR family regulator
MSGADWIERAYRRRARDPSSALERKERADDGCTIMVVDDNLKVIEALRDVLEGKYAVVACCSSREVEERFRDDIKLVILDIKMVPDDGIAIFSLLRQRSGRVPIIFHTAYPGNSEIVARMRELASDGYLLKGDYSLSHLEAVIEQALRRRSTPEGA